MPPLTGNLLMYEVPMKPLLTLTSNLSHLRAYTVTFVPVFNIGYYKLLGYPIITFSYILWKFIAIKKIESPIKCKK